MPAEAQGVTLHYLKTVFFSTWYVKQAQPTYQVEKTVPTIASCMILALARSRPWISRYGSFAWLGHAPRQPS